MSQYIDGCGVDNVVLASFPTVRWIRQSFIFVHNFCYTNPNMADEGEVVENQAPAPEPAPAEVPAEPAPAAPEPAEAQTPVSEPEEPAPEQVATPPEAEQAPRVVTRSRTAVGERMRKVVRTRKRERLDKIMEYAAQKRVIRNRDVKLLLQVSDVTASRYLKELVNKGQLKQLGRGRGAWYELI